MQENDLKQSIDRHPVLNIALVIVFVGLSFLFVGPFIGMILASPFYDGSMEEMIPALANPEAYPNIKIPFYIVQGCAALIGLIVAPWILMSKTSRPVKKFFKDPVDLLPAVVVVFLVIVFMGVNSVFIEWNSKLQLPDFLKELEQQARLYEDRATEITKFLTTFDSPVHLLLAMLVIAIIPAIGEEIVFRGLIQNDIARATGKAHLAIWLSAILFSAIHFQFFGFVPRVFLGALFGYLYYWSGSLSFAIIAHFVNNGFSVMAMYFYQKGSIDIDLDTPESAPIHLVIISFLLTAGLLYYFFRYFEGRKPPISSL